jgi:phospholipid transport system substrate-binding protein
MTFLTFCLGGPLRCPAADTPASPSTPRGVIENVVRDALAILRDTKLPPDEKRQKVRQIAYDNMNFEVMARLSLGRYYRNLSDAQRAQYAEAFRQHVTNTYRHTTDHYTDEDVKITGDRREQDGDWTVPTQILDSKGQQVAKVDYRLRSAENQWKVIDLTIDGVSLVANFRSQFQDIMNSGGIDKLLQLLRDKNAANDK